MMLSTTALARLAGVAAAAAAALAVSAATGLSATPDAGSMRLPPLAGTAGAAADAADGLQTAVLSGGCFWGVQGVFSHVRGVRSVVSGYAGGTAASADYETVSTGTTGHAESVKIVFDPRQVSYAEILRIFFSVATDPTQLNAQYPDTGPQYRSEIFYATPQQERAARAYIEQLNGVRAFSRPIVTRVDPLKGFYPAEAHHQDYLFLHPDQRYIATFDLPKVAALKRLFPQVYQDTAVLVRPRG